MSETVFLIIAASAAAFKAVAIVLGVVWAFRSLLTQDAALLNYRYSHAKLPFRSGNRRE